MRSGLTVKLWQPTGPWLNDGASQTRPVAAEMLEVAGGLLPQSRIDSSYVLMNFNSDTHSKGSYRGS